MDDSKNNKFPNSQWKQFEEFFGMKFPFPDNSPPTDLSWVEQYVQDAINKTMSQSMAGFNQQTSSAPLRHETFETVNHVIVKVHVSGKERAKNMKLLAGIHQLRVEEGVGVQKLNIPLPAEVIPESCKAVYKNGILQLHLKKQQVDDYFHEVNIRFLT
ncbi:Hsp20/alpha crystallin family protein [Paenibacillus tarimensis]